MNYKFPWFYSDISKVEWTISPLPDKEFKQISIDATKNNKIFYKSSLTKEELSIVWEKLINERY